MGRKSSFLIFSIFFLVINLSAQQGVFPGADESTPSKAQYFSWINNTNEGATEKQTLINLEFFAWLKSEYGMQLDIYAFDAGAIDGKRFYGSVNSVRFKKQFPNGFEPVYQKARKSGIRLGVWGGPDGFGNTPEEENERTEQMVGLCRDYDFALFKFDAVCGALRPEKEDAFINMMKECRKYSPDLILLNHRLGLERAEVYATTFLWGGNETYIDVFMTNTTTAPHHRAGAISRGLVPGLKRLTEDHGVCLSSCLDNWDDDLILQAFNRNLILAPEIYGNPWLLNDNEFAKLARIYNLHRKYDSILVSGLVLPETGYGKYAVSRGNGETRLITLRNLSWEPKEYQIKLAAEIGLYPNASVRVFQLHPHEKYLGEYKKSDIVSVTVEPFRSALFIASTQKPDEPYIKGAEYDIVRNVSDKSALIDIWGLPGTSAEIKLENAEAYGIAELNGNNKPELLDKGIVKVSFPGRELSEPPNRKLKTFEVVDNPDDAGSLYESTVYAADNNALEVRSLERSGETVIPQVKAARDAFFKQKTFRMRGIWDKNLFDGDMKTAFWPSNKYNYDLKIKGGCLRLDLGAITNVDEIIVHVPDMFSLQPLLVGEGNYCEISKDLKTWKKITYIAGLEMHIPINGEVRYLRLKTQPRQISEIDGYFKGSKLDSTKWRASNLFAHPDRLELQKTWSSGIVLDEIPENSYLSVALNGKHGVEGAYVAMKVDGRYIGSSDRSPSYPSNTWEYIVMETDSNYTYYIPLTDEYLNKEIEVFVLAYDEKNLDFKPELYLSTPNNAKTKIRLELK
jgi:hypothetical protein